MDIGVGIRKLTLGALAFSSMFAVGRLADAQQVTGTLGQADATDHDQWKTAPSTASEVRRRDH